MSGGLVYALGGAMVFALGLGGAILSRSLVRRILAFNILSSGIFLMLIGLGQRGGAVDPVPQAMVLTGIVVTVAGTALALVLARRLGQEAENTGRRVHKAGPGGRAAAGGGAEEGRGGAPEPGGEGPA